MLSDQQRQDLTFQPNAVVERKDQGPIITSKCCGVLNQHTVSPPPFVVSELWLTNSSVNGEKETIVSKLHPLKVLHDPHDEAKYNIYVVPYDSVGDEAGHVNT